MTYAQARSLPLTNDKALEIEAGRALGVEWHKREEYIKGKPRACECCGKKSNIGITIDDCGHGFEAEKVYVVPEGRGYVMKCGACMGELF